MSHFLEPSAWLTMAASLHLLQLPTTAWLARRRLALASELLRLSTLNQRIVLIFMGAVSFLVIGLAVVVLCFSHDLLALPVGRALCLTLGTFWTTRALAQVWLGSVWPQQRRGRVSYIVLLALYTLLALLYMGAWVSNGAVVGALAR